MHAACLLAAALAIPAGTAPPGQPIRFPADAGVVDVTAAPYNARADGRSDDTAAIQRALDDHPCGNAIVYLPAGTYLVSRQLRWPTGRPGGGDDCKRLILQGESSAATVLKLKDNCDGFGEPGRDKRYGRPTGTGVIWTGKAPAQRFRNAVRNLTIDTGRGNAGACGLQFVANNQGCVREVTIRSGDGAGVIGLDLGYTGEQGPCLIEDLRVEGFDYGVYCWGAVDSITMVGVHVRGQRLAGLRNDHQVLNIERLTSVNAVPAVQNRFGDAVLTLLGADLRTPGGPADVPAIANEGLLHARDVATAGYARAIDNSRGTKRGAAGPRVGEYVSHERKGLFGKPGPALRLPVKPTPRVPWDPPAEWISPAEFGARGDDKADDTAAIQKAIDSGRTTVYLPRGTWTISGELLLRGNVRRFLGCEAALKGRGVLRVVDGNQPVVVLERFEIQYAPIRIVHDTARTLVLSSIRMDRENGYRNTVPGEVFIEDVCGNPFRFERQKVWARQLNPESSKRTKITARDSQLWILGLKTEGDATAIDAAGGRVEVCGAFIYANTPRPKQPLVILRDTEMSMTMGESAYRREPFRKLVVETRGKRTRTLGIGDVPARCGGSMVGLFTTEAP